MHKGWKLFGRKNMLRKEAKQYFDTGDHCADFLDAIRNGRRPNADIEIGHLSATLPHLTNILARTGRRTIDLRSEDRAVRRRPGGRRPDQAHLSRGALGQTVKAVGQRIPASSIKETACVSISSP